MQHRNLKEGFTLLEILITIVVMETCFVLFLQAISICLFAGGQNESELVAVALANEKIEDIRNIYYDDIVNEGRASVPGFSTFEREVIVTIPYPNMKQVVVNVYWPGKGEDASDSLVTYVSDI